MILACMIYSVAVLAVLGFIIRTEHRHMCRGRESAQPDITVEPNYLDMFPNRRNAARISKALYQWMSDGSDSELQPRQPVMQPEREPEVVETPAASAGAAPASAQDAQPVGRLRHEREQNMAFEAESGAGSHASPMLQDFSTLPPATNYYELLQISPNADIDTIQRVYRFMATRFHPDNPNTGNNERFLLLKQAFEVLADPRRRAEYDAAHNVREAAPLPIFGHKVFLDGIEGEMNRRFGVLSLLYYRRRISGATPGLSLLELEKRMAFPREYLEFTLWYLLRKGYIALTDTSSDYALTETGVDYVEMRSSSNKVVRDLLAAGTGAGLPELPEQQGPGDCRARRSSSRNSRRRRLQRSPAMLEARTVMGAAS